MEMATAARTGPFQPGNNCMGMRSMSREEDRVPISTGWKLSWRASSIICCLAASESLQMYTYTAGEQRQGPVTVEEGVTYDTYLCVLTPSHTHRPAAKNI